MIVKYKCECMKEDEEAEVLVPDRRPNSSRDNWMDAVRMCVAQDHRALSPNCQAGDYQYMVIPEEVETEKGQ